MRPMSEAPRDGRQILLHLRAATNSEWIAAEWYKDSWIDGGEGVYAETPFDGWLPLPDALKEENKALRERAEKAEALNAEIEERCGRAEAEVERLTASLRDWIHTAVHAPEDGAQKLLERAEKAEAWLLDMKEEAALWNRLGARELEQREKAEAELAATQQTLTAERKGRMEAEKALDDAINEASDGFDSHFCKGLKARAERAEAEAARLREVVRGLREAGKEAQRAFSLLHSTFAPNVFPIYIESGHKVSINGKDYGEIAELCGAMWNTIKAALAAAEEVGG